MFDTMNLIIEYFRALTSEIFFNETIYIVVKKCILFIVISSSNILECIFKHCPKNVNWILRLKCGRVCNISHQHAHLYLKLNGKIYLLFRIVPSLLVAVVQTVASFYLLQEDLPVKFPGSLIIPLITDRPMS